MYEASDSDRYATLFYAEYDPGRRCLSYVNAGHNAPMLCSQDARDVGRCSGWKRWHGSRSAGGQTVQTGNAGAEDWRLLVAFTDGISEAMNAAEEEFGESRLMKAIEGCDSLTAAEIAKRLLGAVDTFVASARQHDDMTLVVMRLVYAE